MSILDKDSPQVLVTSDMNSIPIITADIVYEGAMVGIVTATGHGRPLENGDIFAGHSIFKVDNTLGLVGGEKDIRLRSGKYRLYCSIAVGETFVAADVGAPLYASDDDTLTKTKASGSYVGRIARYISPTKLEVEFNTLQPVDKT